MEHSYRRLPRATREQRRAAHLQQIQETYQALSPKEQADRLGLSISYVCKLRSLLIRTGAVSRFDGTVRVRWDPRDLATIQESLVAGESLSTIAARYNASAHAIIQALHRVGTPPTALRAGLWRVRSATDVARLFGVHNATVMLWIRLRWLKARRDGAWSKKRARQKTCSRYLIADESVLAFLQMREAWVSWDVEGIVDSDWREAATDIRRIAGGHWKLAADWAEEVGYARSYAGTLCRTGHTCMPQPKKILGRWYVWVADARGGG